VGVGELFELLTGSFGEEDSGLDGVLDVGIDGVVEVEVENKELGGAL
jgi:hypothetical protein